MRKTKHSGIGHEDTAYSYVVVRRGLRPTQIETKVGRIGQVGKRELEKLAQAEIPLMELLIDGEHHQTDALEVIPDDGSALDHAESRFMNNAVEVADRHHQVEATLRQEAYGWPRLVFPPLKRSGHVILDSCTPEGKHCSVSRCVSYQCNVLQERSCALLFRNRKVNSHFMMLANPAGGIYSRTNQKICHKKGTSLFAPNERAGPHQ